MSNGQNDQNSEVISLLRLVLTQVNTLTADVQEVKTSQQALATNHQVLAADVQEVKADVKEMKSWARVTDNRLGNMENKIVDFATQLGNLDEKVETRLHDTRPMWEALNLRLNAMEAELATIKDNQGKSEQATQEFRQEILFKFKNLEKDLQTFRRNVQIDVLSFAKDLASLEERLEKVESKLEAKN